MSRVDFKTLVIGVLLGIIVMMARGATVETAFVQRYQICVEQKGSNECFYVLDHKTNKVYRSYDGGPSVESPPIFEIKTPDQ